MLSTLKTYSSIIKDYNIISFERSGFSFRLRARIELINGFYLHVRETIIDGTKRKYAYHWQDSDANLLIRWDNAPDWNVETFPHHKHLGAQDNVLSSYERTLEQVLPAIQRTIIAKEKT